MCFNAPISNPDDHPRNHAIIAWDRDWKLSPAYDLTPMSLIGLEWRDLAMMCGDAGRAAAATNLRSHCARFFINTREAERIVREMAYSIERCWYYIARGEAVSLVAAFVL